MNPWQALEFHGPRTVTGDCRASAQIRDGLMDWLAGRTVAEARLTGFIRC